MALFNFNSQNAVLSEHFRRPETVVCGAVALMPFSDRPPVTEVQYSGIRAQAVLKYAHTYQYPRRWEVTTRAAKARFAKVEFVARDEQDGCCRATGFRMDGGAKCGKG